MKKQEGKEKENSKPHFAKIIDYSPEETWRTDILIGQKGFKPHGHLTLSGASIFYLRDETGNVLIDKGIIQENKEKPTKG